jgi:ATP-binding cassette, subfamily C (CFTR/MRP), member 1
LYALLGESVDGAAVIRAFGAQETLYQRMVTILDKQQHAYFLTCTAQSWLAVRLELVANLIVTFACASAVLQHALDGANTRFAGLAGLAISYSLSVTQSLNWSVRMASDLEAAMVSVERIKEYSTLESEGAQTTPIDTKVEGNFPSTGTIEFIGAKLRYRPELPLVLNGLDLKIPGGSKVGVVGRTGAGKSTLMVSLMRIVELDEGKICIDGIDTHTLGLSKLRGSIAVIPQDPLLFSGTVRTNLDPFDDYTDKVLFEVLERVGLYKPLGGKNMSSDSLVGMSNNRVDSLDNIVSEGGSNFSVGQRQLLVIA